jgi:hypothetical protein
LRRIVKSTILLFAKLFTITARMATPTVPTVLFPTPTGDDTDDDDDDDVSSVLPAQPTPSPIAPISEQPSPPIPSAPEASPTSVTPDSPSSVFGPSGSVIPLPDNLPSSTPQADRPTNDDKGLSVGAKAGIGVGVAFAAIMMLVLIWLYLRRQNWRQQRKRKTSHDPRDAEKAHTTTGAEVRAYGASAVSELAGGGQLSADDKARRYSELASPVVAQEVHGDREFAAELQGSTVPMSTGHKEEERWSSEVPNHSTEHAEPLAEKKSGARLFDDAPIDETDTIIDVDDLPRSVDKKGRF